VYNNEGENAHITVTLSSHLDLQSSFICREFGSCSSDSSLLSTFWLQLMDVLIQT